MALASVRCPPADSPEMKHLHARREKLGGYLPSRSGEAPVMEVPALESFGRVLAGSGDRQQS